MSISDLVAQEAVSCANTVAPQLNMEEPFRVTPSGLPTSSEALALPAARPVGQPPTEIVASVAFSHPSNVGRLTDSNVLVSPPVAPILPLNGSANGPSHEPINVNFLVPSGYLAPSNFFHYAPNPAFGSAQQSSSLALGLAPPNPAAALQPPAPGQFANRPSFSYNIVSQANVSSATGQQFQPATSANHVNMQTGKFVQTTTAASLQPPVPGHSVRPHLNILGISSPVPQIPISVPKLEKPAATYPSFNQSPKLEQQIVSENNMPSTNSSNTSDTAESSSTSKDLVSPQCSQSVSAFSSSGVQSDSSPSTISSCAQASSGPPLSENSGNPVVHDGMPALTSSAVAISQAPNISSSPSICPIPGYHASVTSIPLSVSQNMQLPFYPPYASVPTMAVPPPAPWMYPLQNSGFPRPQILPFPPVLPMLLSQGLAVPSSNIQPPGVSHVPSHGMIPFFSGSVSQSSSSAACEHQNDEGNQKNEAEAWTSHRTETGAIYYFNSFTGQSTYERPCNFIGEPEKAAVQSTPVSWEKLEGTGWTLVTTNDGKKYYYDNKNKTSSWLEPPEVAEFRRASHVEPLKTDESQQPSITDSDDKGSSQVSLNAPALLTGGRDATGARSSGAPITSALDLIKKKLQDSGTPITSPLTPSYGPATSDLNSSKVVDTPMKEPQTNTKDKDKDAIGDDNLSDTSSDSDDVENETTTNECIIQFKEMLKERGVAPFSKWDKELPKIVFDPRFKAVQGYSTRKALFERFVRTRAEEVRKEERAAQRAAIDGFKQLLEEASEDIDHRTDYDSFKRKWGSDPRFKALKRKDVELLMNEKVHPLKKTAEEKIQAVRMATVASFKSMLREKGDITANSRWSRVKDSFRNDSRYKTVSHEERELLFKEFVSELKASERVAEEAAKAKRDEQEKLRERERETRKRKEREEQEMERIRLKIRRKEAISAFQALLVETIKDPKATWSESKAKLEKDPQGRTTNPDLSLSDAEKLFREHVKDLYERFTRDFRDLLAEVITPEVANKATGDGKMALNSWSEAKQLLKPDPRYAKTPRKERESLWLRHADDLIRKQKSAAEAATTADARGKPDMESKGGRAPPSSDTYSRSPRKYHIRR